MRSRLFYWCVAIAVCFGIYIVGNPARAQWQLPQLRVPQSLTGSPNIVVGCVNLDGRCILELAASPTELPGRLAEIETRLQAISRQYRRSKPVPALQVYARDNNGLTDLHVAIGERDVRLLTVTTLDAQIQGLNVAELVRDLEQDLPADLMRSRQERELVYLSRQGRRLGLALAIALAIHLAIAWSCRRVKNLELSWAQLRGRQGEQATAELTRAGKVDLAQLARQLLRVLQLGIWVGLGFYGLNLFPQTRPWQGLLLVGLRIPLRVGLVAFGTWVALRLSFVAIDRLTAALGQNVLLAPEASWRLQLRLRTISGVSKGIVAVAWYCIGALVALAIIGIDIGPILAGAGILGLAVSLASQNLIRDALNGFFIILEDQYGVGDAISLNDEIGGLVENINLRITQLRDIEGRLITIPNSEIRIVANLSSNWSRSDLKIPLAYHADTDRAIEVVRGALQMLWQDPEWSASILEKPEILGVDGFTDRGLILRILIKTQPLKQWPVARESRRRIKAALDAAGIPLAVAQERIWIEGGAASGSSSFPQ